MITQVDQWVGKLLETLHEKGLDRNTLVVFTSDHGEMLGDHGLHSKGIMFEGSVHVPLIMRLPGRIPPGLRIAHPVSHFDLFPMKGQLLEWMERARHPLKDRLESTEL